MAVDTTCAACGAALSLPATIGRKDECPQCGAELRACRQCASYDTTRPNECRDPSAERVRDKERANFCEFFRLRPAQSPGGPSKADLRAAAEALFKKKTS